MTNIFLERRFDPPIGAADVTKMAIDGAGCFSIHRVAWNGSFLAADGTRMLCSFSAADTESARVALRQSGADTRVLWRGDIADAPGVREDDIDGANVLVERSFDEPVTLKQIQDMEDAGIGCLEMRNVRFIRTFFSADRRRMLCLYRAPDAESVRQAQREAGVPFDEAWSFRRFTIRDVCSIKR